VVDAVKHVVKSECASDFVKLKFINALFTETHHGPISIAKQPEALNKLFQLLAAHCVSLYYTYFVMFKNNKTGCITSKSVEKKKMIDFGKAVDAYLKGPLFSDVESETLFTDAVAQYLQAYKLN